MENQLDSVFNPRSIAIAGVSRKDGTIGRLLMQNIIEFGYKGSVYPIHPKAVEIASLKAFKRLIDITDDVDMLISIIPRDSVINLIKDAIIKKVKSIIIITAGFKEIDSEGEILEKKIYGMIKNAGIRVIGPNSMGVINTYNVLMNASFSPVLPLIGNISFISQSGAIGAVLMGYAREYGLGLSKFASIGNKMDVNISHLLKYLKQDANTKIITSYLESFSDPKNFIRIASEVSAVKPIIMVKSGRTDRGSTAATSHTGALASSEIVVDCVLKKSGVIRVDRIKDLIHTSMIFLKCTLQIGRRVVVISNAGGPGTLATDSLIKHGMIVDDPSPHIKEELRSFLPLEASIDNPIDILPSAGIDGYKKTLETVLKDEKIDMALVIMLPPIFDTIDKLFMTVDEVAKNSTKPVIGWFIGDTGVIESYPDLHYPIYEHTEIAANMMNHFVKYSEWRQKIEEVKILNIPMANKSKVKNIINNAENNQLLQYQVEKIFELYGFNMPKSSIISDINELKDACNDIAYPLVIKIASKYISHKSDSGGVLIDIKNYENAKKAYNSITEIYNTHNIPNSDREILIQKFYKGGIEIALGATYDEQFGHMIMVGMGGTLVEILNDVVFNPIPLGKSEAMDMIKSLRGYEVLTGYRKSNAVDLDLVADYIRRIAQMVIDNPKIKELDINPLYSKPKESKSVILDVRMSLK